MFEAAYQALQSGRAADAESISRQWLKSDPGGETPLLLLALSIEAQGRPREALPIFEQLAMRHPGTTAHWINLGSVRRALADSKGAREAYERALEIDPHEANALLNLGLLALDAGQFQAAREALRRAVQAAPLDASIRSEAANAEFANGNASAAESLLEGWEQWAASDPLSLGNIGWQFAKLGQADDAQRAIDLAARMLPGHPKIQVRRAAFLERANRVDEAREQLARIDPSAASREAVTEDVRIVRAHIAARGSDLDLALRLHEEIVFDPVAARRNPELLTAIGRLHDKRGDTAAAMDWFQRAHATQLDELRERSPKWLEAGADPLDITRFRISADERAAWTVLPEPSVEESFIFVVGFPRSGTTMLETMLDAHPALAGMDERAFLQDVIDDLRAMRMTYPEDIARLDAEQAERLRSRYWDLVRRRARIPPGKRLVDKNPLNILRLPLISRLFPRAKIILALRHPCDVVLSNFMQTFRTPAYVALTSTLASTARGYADTFDFWVDQAAVLKPDVVDLRYEDVVDDIEAQSRRITDFLGMPWDERMINFHERAKERGYIATPSYHQVIEPVNRKGVARWERYRNYLDPVIPVLRPHIERWGYTV